MTQPSELPVKIILSIGLIALVVAHAVLPAILDRMLPAACDPCDCDACSGKESTPRGGINFDTMQSAGGAKTTLPVNVRARNELKQQAPCANCPPRVIVNQQPSSQVPQSQAKAVPTKPRYSIALFVGTDARSNQLLDWFNNDPVLVKEKAKVNFHVYTKDNAIYQSRYAQEVPVEYFPALVFTDPSGGHVHAAFQDMLPSTPEALRKDLARAYSLQQQVVAAKEASGPLPSTQLTLEDCPGGECKLPLNRDRDRDTDPLFDRRDDQVKSILDFVINTGGQSQSLLMIVLFAIGGFMLLKK